MDYGLYNRLVSGMDYTRDWYRVWTIAYGLLLMDYVSNHTGVKLPGTSDGLIPYF